MPRHPLAPILSVGSAVALGAVLLCRTREEPTVPPPLSSEPEAVWASDVDTFGPGLLGVGLRAIGPLPGQKRPPCTPHRERELVGACWIGTEHRPPCPQAVYEVEGRCVLPVESAKRPPTSLGR